jgi:hypothetical protein
MQGTKLESTIPIVVTSTPLHPGGNILVWLCYRRRRYGFCPASFPSATGMEAAAYSV